jgi:hypothetical protein
VRRSTRHALAAALVAISLVLAACGDDGDTDTTGSTTTNEATTTTTTTSTPTDTTEPATDEQDALDAVRTFAEETVGMVDPVVGPFTPAPGDDDLGTVEVRTRREGGAEDLTLPATDVVVRRTESAGAWQVESASGPLLSFDSPPPGPVLSAGFVTPSGRATAYEGTVVVQVLANEVSGVRVLGEVVTTSDEGNTDAAWAARLDTGRDYAGPGYVLAMTTAGTDLGPPAFAVVPVVLETP